MVKHEANRMEEYASEASHLVSDNPLPSALVIFGAGLGLGLVISHLLAEPISRYTTHQPTGMERYQKQLMDALRGLAPSAFT